MEPSWPGVIAPPALAEFLLQRAGEFCSPRAAGLSPSRTCTPGAELPPNLPGAPPELLVPLPGPAVPPGQAEVRVWLSGLGSTAKQRR